MTLPTFQSSLQIRTLNFRTILEQFLLNLKEHKD